MGPLAVWLRAALKWLIRAATAENLLRHGSLPPSGLISDPQKMHGSSGAYVPQIRRINRTMFLMTMDFDHFIESASLS
jgi:hypothetical protein